MRIKQKLAVFLGVILTITIAGTAIYVASVPSKYRKIEISTAHRKNLTQSISEEGVVEPVKKQVIDIQDAQDVLEVLVEEGQAVKKGDLVLRLSNSEEENRLNLEEINLKLAERELSKALKDEKSDLLEVEYSYKQAETSLASAKAELSAAQKNLASDKLLFETGAISRAEYEAALENERSKGNEFLLKELELNRASQAFADFDLDRDEKIYKLQSNITVIKENIRSLQAKLAENTAAAIDGRVVKLDAEDEILIYDVSAYNVSLQLRQQDALYIKEGMTAKIKVRGMEEKEYKGKVLDIGEVAVDSRTNVKITIDNPDENIKPGYEVEVKIDLNIKNEAVVVDYQSIVQDKDGKKFIYYVKNNVARRVAVTTGIETDFEVEILEGVIQGDRYVVNPPEKMQNENSVKIWGWRYESK
jgi:multidrug efflux pump subunit AcrA (membrane-fusion protein)